MTRPVELIAGTIAETASALTAALAEVQANLPSVGKTETAQVKSDKGSYSYHYADLAAVSKAVLPLLGKHGLAFVARPTLSEGRLVLAYELRHKNGESIGGEYPLSGNTPQQVGSAITYARRHCLCSVTGVAPESDDDDAKAASTRQAEPYDPGPIPAEVLVLRDEALEAATRDELTAIWKKASVRERAYVTENEHGDEERLGDLIRRRGEEIDARTAEATDA